MKWIMTLPQHLSGLSCGLLLLISAPAVAQVDFDRLNLPSTPNYYLACPVGYCQGKANMQAPTFPVPVEQLTSYWQQLIAKQPRIKAYPAAQRDQLYYVQRSRVFRFPDDISVRLVAINDKHSSLLIYSRSRYGHWDFGVNQRRVKAWLHQLQELIALDHPSTKSE